MTDIQVLSNGGIHMKNRRSSHRRFNNRREMMRSRSLKNVTSGAALMAAAPAVVGTRPVRTRSLSNRLHRSQSVSRLTVGELLEQQQQSPTEASSSTAPTSPTSPPTAAAAAAAAAQVTQPQEEEESPFNDAFGDDVFDIDPNADHSSGDFSWQSDDSERRTRNTAASATHTNQQEVLKSPEHEIPVRQMQMRRSGSRRSLSRKREGLARSQSRTRSLSKREGPTRSLSKSEGLTRSFSKRGVLTRSLSRKSSRGGKLERMRQRSMRSVGATRER